MAVGRQDYQAGVVPIKSGYSLSQTPHFKTDGIQVFQGADGYLCTYTVPVGYELNVTGFRISTDFPGIQFLVLQVDGNTKMAKFYDSLIVDNFPEGSNLVVERGEVIRIKVTNSMVGTNWYWGEMLGYLEQKIV